METVVSSHPIGHSRNRARSEKGERSRQAILNATIACIADYGLNGVTHRKVAERAGVPHSLTTYFFASLDEMIEQAFEHFLTLSTDENDELLVQATAYINTLDSAHRVDPVQRGKVIDHLARLITDFIVAEVKRHPVGISIQLNVLYAYRKGDHLRPMALAHRARIVDQIASIIRTLAPERDPTDASTDASLVLSLLHKLELDCINQPAQPPVAQMHSELHRMLRLIFTLVETGVTPACVRVNPPVSV